MDKDIKKKLEEIRERVPAEVLVNYHMAIVMGHEPQFVDDGEGGLEVVWPADGKIDNARRDASLKWLAERAHGDAPGNTAIDKECE